MIKNLHIQVQCSVQQPWQSQCTLLYARANCSPSCKRGSRLTMVWPWDCPQPPGTPLQHQYLWYNSQQSHPAIHDEFPGADIHKLLTPNLLHQAIKGTFKDHLVEQVKDHLTLKHGALKAAKILDEIDRWCYTQKWPDHYLTKILACGKHFRLD